MRGYFKIYIRTPRGDRLLAKVETVLRVSGIDFVEDSWDNIIIVRYGVYIHDVIGDIQCDLDKKAKHVTKRR